MGFSVLLAERGDEAVRAAAGAWGALWRGGGPRFGAACGPSPPNPGLAMLPNAAYTETRQTPLGIRNPIRTPQVELFSRGRGSLAAVLLDLQMPGALDGWDAALAMREIELDLGDRDLAGNLGDRGDLGDRGRSGGAAGAGSGAGSGVVIVACTACAPDGEVPARAGGGGGAGRTVRQHALACGMDAVVHKPCPTAALGELVAALLRQRGGGGVDEAAGAPAAAGGAAEAGAGAAAPAEAVAAR